MYHTFSRHESALSSLPAVLLVLLWIVLSARIGVLLVLVTSILFLFGLFRILLDRCRVLFESKSRLLCFESLKDYVQSKILRYIFFFPSLLSVSSFYRPFVLREKGRDHTVTLYPREPVPEHLQLGAVSPRRPPLCF
jgi:hypothetical protein